MLHDVTSIIKQRQLEHGAVQDWPASLQRSQGEPGFCPQVMGYTKLMVAVLDSACGARGKDPSFSGMIIPSQVLVHLPAATK